MTELLITNLSKHFGTAKALDDITIQVKENEFIAILGPSGCGKTTLLRSVAGFIEPTAGSIRFGEQAFSENEDTMPVEDRQLGMVFQHFALWPHMTIKEHLEYPLKSSQNKKRFNEAVRKEMIRQALQLVELEGFEDRYPNELSGGQKQRIALARGFLEEPVLPLLDELTNHLDFDGILWLEELIRNSRSACVIITHDRRFLDAVTTRIVELDRGILHSFQGNFRKWQKQKAAWLAAEQLQNERFAKFLAQEEV